MNGDAAQHIEMLRRNGVEIDPSLELPECPPAMAHIMDWYDELRAWCQQGFNGVAPLTWSDVSAWRGEMEIAPKPRPSEYRLLMQLDTRFRAAAAKHKPAEKPRRPQGRDRRGR